MLEVGRNYTYFSLLLLYKSSKLIPVLLLRCTQGSAVRFLLYAVPTVDQSLLASSAVGWDFEMQRADSGTCVGSRSTELGWESSAASAVFMHVSGCTFMV